MEEFKMRRVIIFLLSVIFTLLFTMSAFTLTKEERAWKEDILTLLPLVKRVGDYTEMVDLVEVAPALKKDPEIRKAFITFAPPGATPPEWAKEEKEAPPVRIEVPEKITTAETAEKLADAAEEKKKEEEARRIAQEVAVQRKIAIAEAPKEKERRKMEEGIKKELGVRPTPLPKGAKVIRSTDVVSEVRAEMVEGRMRVTITLSGERKYTISDRAQPPTIIIDIPRTINAVSPGRIMVNQGGVSTIEVTQHRATPFDETRVIIRLSRFKEYEVKSKANEIYVEFQE